MIETSVKNELRNLSRVWIEIVVTDIDYSKNFEEKLNSWISKQNSKGVIDNNWKRFITPTNSTPGKMYGLVKSHKVNKPVRVITSGCNTATESLSIYIEHVLFELSKKCAIQNEIQYSKVPNNRAPPLIFGKIFRTPPLLLESPVY